MRYFNTSGPCDPEKHYTVLRKQLTAEGLDKINRGRYITIFAPRQAGKTTFFQLLLEELKKAGRYTPIWISFETLQNATKSQFYKALNLKLNQELTAHGIKAPLIIKNELDLTRFFEEIRTHWKVDRYTHHSRQFRKAQPEETTVSSRFASVRSRLIRLQKRQ